MVNIWVCNSEGCVANFYNASVDIQQLDLILKQFFFLPKRFTLKKTFVIYLFAENMFEGSIKYAF